MAEAGDEAGLPQFVELELQEFPDVRLVRGRRGTTAGGVGVRAAEDDCGVTDRELE